MIVPATYPPGTEMHGAAAGSTNCASFQGATQSFNGVETGMQIGTTRTIAEQANTQVFDTFLNICL